MNIFFIPSWYPSLPSMTQGIFCKEQALAIGQVNQSWIVAISCWGQDACHLPFSKLHTWPKTLLAYWKNKYHQTKSLRPNVTEYHTHLLHWNERIVSYKTYFEHILEVNRLHLKKVIALHGKIDLIHAHVALPAGIVANKLSQEFNIPYVITEHIGPFPAPLFLTKNGTLKPEILEAYNAAQFVIGVSPYQVRQLSLAGISAIMIPNLIDGDRFQPFFNPLNEKTKKVTFFTLATTLCQEKGVDDLISAIAQIHTKLPHAYFRIGGKGNLKHYQSIIKSFNIENQVVLLGNLSREKVIEELKNCNAFILPSHQETFGMVYAEALACGKPVIATRCGGGEFIIEEGQGILIEPKNKNELTSAIISMYEKAHEYCPKSIRTKTLRRFSKEVVVGELTKVYIEAALASKKEYFL